MAAPQFIEEKPLSLVDAKEILRNIEKRDKDLNYLSNKVREYLDAFVALTPQKKEELFSKLNELSLTRLKEEHMAKIIDFLPQSVDELRVVFQAYPLSLPKKDQESIVQVIKEAVKA